MSSFLYFRAIACMCSRVCVVSFILCSIHACLLVSLSLSLSLPLFLCVCVSHSLSPSLYMYVRMFLSTRLPLCLYMYLPRRVATGSASVPTPVLFPLPAAWALRPTSPPSEPPADSDAPLTLCRRHDNLSAGTYFQFKLSTPARGGCRSCVRALIGVMLLRNGDRSCRIVRRSRARGKPPVKRGFASHSASFHIVRSRGVAVCTVYTLSVILTYSVYTVSSPRQYIHCLKYCETVYTLYTKRRTMYIPSQVLDSIYIVRMMYTLSQFTLGV